MGADARNSTMSTIVNDTERCNSLKCKLLRSKLIGVTDSLLTALDDIGNDFAVVNGPNTCNKMGSVVKMTLFFQWILLYNFAEILAPQNLHN